MSRVYVSVTNEDGVLMDHFAIESECLTHEALSLKVRESVTKEAKGSAGFQTFWLTED